MYIFVEFLCFFAYISRGTVSENLQKAGCTGRRRRYIASQVWTRCVWGVAPGVRSNVVFVVVRVDKTISRGFFVRFVIYFLCL